MLKENFQKAVELQNKISKLEQALGCFEYQNYKYIRNNETDNYDEIPDGEPISTNPKLTIDYINWDEDSGESLQLPFQLNNELIDVLKHHIKAELVKLNKEFELL